MKLHLSEISKTGWERSFSLPLVDFTRLKEVHGEQSGACSIQLNIRNHEGSLDVRGQLKASVVAGCQRCLDPVPQELDEAIRISMVPKYDYDAQEADIHLGEGELEVSFYTGEEIDIHHLIEDELLLLLPDAITGEDAEGNCDYCGKSLESMFADEPADENDHPFAAMRDMFTKK